MAVKASATITLSAVVDVDYVTRYYLLQSSTAQPPSAPTTKPPTGNWTDSEPSYTSGSTNSLYFCDLTVFSDSTWAYSKVSLSSSYEAAKEAYNRAEAAGDAAEAAQGTADRAIAQISVTQGNIDIVAGDVGTLFYEMGINSEGLRVAGTRIDDAEGKIDAIDGKLDAQQDWMTFDTNGLTMGQTGSPFTVNLTSQQLTFNDNGVDVAYINGQQYYITDGQITNSLTLGKYKFVPQDGHLSLTYTG